MSLALPPDVSYLAYLVAAVLFIIGIKQLSSPKTARNGNLVAAVGMGLALAVTLVEVPGSAFAWILGGIVIGTAVGAYSARTVAMTDMPQLVALFNGSGGGAAAPASAPPGLGAGE